MYTPSTSLKPFGGHFGEGEGIGRDIFLAFFLTTFFLVVFLTGCFLLTFFSVFPVFPVFLSFEAATFFFADGEAFGAGLLAAATPKEMLKVVVALSIRRAIALPRDFEPLLMSAPT